MDPNGRVWDFWILDDDGLDPIRERSQRESKDYRLSKQRDHPSGGGGRNEGKRS